MGETFPLSPIKRSIDFSFRLSKQICSQCPNCVVSLTLLSFSYFFSHFSHFPHCCHNDFMRNVYVCCCHFDFFSIATAAACCCWLHDNSLDETFAIQTVVVKSFAKCRWSVLRRGKGKFINLILWDGSVSSRWGSIWHNNLLVTQFVIESFPFFFHLSRFWLVFFVVDDDKTLHRKKRNKKRLRKKTIFISVERFAKDGGWKKPSERALTVNWSIDFLTFFFLSSARCSIYSFFFFFFCLLPLQLSEATTWKKTSSLRCVNVKGMKIEMTRT